ncbi:MAG TPA: hypothetical protein VN634_02660 [Candidatus Limnocylindrales bacterium]|nr:hypothetical protein [Candidatus Limnocylindrales bacterium]
MTFRASRRADALVFALVLLSAGYFHQGGGWNQNARFALVRSIVEAHTFFIDSYLVYERDPAATDAFVRVPVRSGNVAHAGSEVALAWRGTSGRMLAIDPAAAGARKLAAVDDVAATGDVAYFDGHFHPNKAPGTSFAAVPGYALVRLVGSVFGANPDSSGALRIGAWLASVLSAGLATAFAAVLILRIARWLASEAAARAAALVFAFATMGWTYGTMLFEHNLIAAALVASVYFVEKEARRREGATDADATAFSPALAAAGFFAGYAAITNYTMALVVPVFALFLYTRLRSVRGLVWFGAGVFMPLAVICAYNQACFGTPFTTNYAYESKLFVGSTGKLFGIFALPQLDVASALLFSPFRGLFFTSPVLLVSVAALGLLWRERTLRPLAMLVAAVAVFLLIVNASFNGWDGGWCAVPRYLAPGMALLAIPVAAGFDRWRLMTIGLAAVSFVIQFLLVAVDPQVPIGDVGISGMSVSSVFLIDPMTRYVVPLFTSGRPWPLLEDAIEQNVQQSMRQALARGDAKADVERKADQLRRELRARIESGERTPFELAGVVGPVSANPIGVYEGYYFQKFPAGSDEAAWNSFNAGEYVFPRSRLSLLPLLLIAGGLLALLFQSDDEDTSEPRPVRAPAPAPAPPSAASGRRTEPRRTRRKK